MAAWTMGFLMVKAECVGQMGGSISATLTKGSAQMERCVGTMAASTRGNGRMAVLMGTDDAQTRQEHPGRASGLRDARWLCKACSFFVYVVTYEAPSHGYEHAAIRS